MSIFLKFITATVAIIACPTLNAYEINSRSCPIVGNSDSYIYHTSGSKYYNEMIKRNKSKKDNRACFKSAAEAEIAGYRKPKK